MKKNRTFLILVLLLIIFNILLNFYSGSIKEMYDKLEEENEKIKSVLNTKIQNKERLLDLNESYALSNQDLKETINDSECFLRNLTEGLEKINENINSTNQNLQENLTKKKQYQSGDKYDLHDPTWGEALDFLNNNLDVNNVDVLINRAKDEGIQCAYVEINMEVGCFGLIGFDTLDYGISYIEADTRYMVYPEVGLNYYDCVYEQPYGFSVPEDNDTITEILVIW